MDSEPTVRRELPSDVAGINALVTEAFGRPAEAGLVDALRAAEALPVSGVADLGGSLIGHVGFSPITIGESQQAMALAPVAVVPWYQRMGVGSALVRWGLEQCRELRCPLVVVLGEPAYYLRFGFRPASAYGISCPFPVPDEAYMALELLPGAGRDFRGFVRYRPEFEVV